jgi:hypothetical protein
MPRNRVVLDTDIASLLWRGKLEPTAHEKLRDRIPTLTFVPTPSGGSGATCDGGAGRG